ncbi:MAG TPA: hypothetical protein VKZ98_12195 [Aquaticitalea sp.]|nr:hypothetical protein [Aquaticitalea sp.]
MQKNLVLVCLLNFLVAALMGLALRYALVQPIPINFRFLTHGHSHVAMLGWSYLMLYVLIVHLIPNKNPRYNRLFWLTEVAVLGMMVSFPIQGYAAISIAFSTLHILCSYYFVRLAWKDLKEVSSSVRYLLKASLLFMLFSTIGVWCLGPAVATLGQTSAFYQIAIQFFLHFQFNGWFLFAVLAVFLNQFNAINLLVFKRFSKLLIVATILTFALPVSWFAFHPMLLWINGLGVVLQVLALYYAMLLLQPHLRFFFVETSKLVRLLFRFALFCLVLKIGLQTLSLIPQVAEMAYQYRNFVIGFIHLIMLGVISGFLFAFIMQSPLVKHKSKWLSFAVYSFITGFLTTELLLFIQGCLYYFGVGMMPNYYIWLLIFSTLLPLGILFLIFNITNHDSKTIKTT